MQVRENRRPVVRNLNPGSNDFFPEYAKIVAKATE